MTCPVEGCDFPEGGCLFDELCDGLDDDLFTEMALECESIAEDSADVDDPDEVEAIVAPLQVLTEILDVYNVPRSSVIAGEILKELTAEGWHLSRADQI